MKFTVEELRAKLLLPVDEKWKDGIWDVEAFKKRNVNLILFAPKDVDYQTFHEEDEFNFVARGQGELVIENERFSCAPGHSFFVAAKTAHRFENFSDDFATWAIFF